jgi:hypothetical protein
MTLEEKIERLESFKDLVLGWARSYKNAAMQAQLRSEINREKSWVRREVIEANCFKTITIGPPPAIGGLVMTRVDPFTMLFDEPYGVSLVEMVVDMIEETIGALRSAPTPAGAIKGEPLVLEETVQGYAFIAMPMTNGRHDFDDVCDAIKEAAQRCGIHAERVDEPHTTDRITDRILESIRHAEYVIADLTEAKPNVYFEAGYAHALRKTPIYIAREGTQLEFDLKDYPVIFFNSLRQLKDYLERRLRGIADQKVSG